MENPESCRVDEHLWKKVFSWFKERAIEQSIITKKEKKEIVGRS
jgi:hypothetical protein